LHQEVPDMARNDDYEVYDADRGVWVKASDEVRSWFGDAAAERRRRTDERMSEQSGNRGVADPNYRYPRYYRTKQPNAPRDEVTGRETLDDPTRGGRFVGDDYPEERYASGERFYGPGYRSMPYDLRRAQNTPSEIGWRSGSYGDRFEPEPAGEFRTYGYRSGSYNSGSYGEPSNAGLGPVGYQRPDARIEEDAHEALTWDHDVDARNITVRVVGGEVTLEGTVPSRSQKRLAEDALARIRGITDIHNRLRVEP
jgi:osmotically-inducible protein OsmY